MMRLSRLLSLFSVLFVAIHTAPAQVAAGSANIQRRQPANPASLPKGRITGRIFCADTHKPARGALVVGVPIPSGTRPERNASGTGFPVRTGLDGSFTLEHLSPGSYGILALLPGYPTGFDDLSQADVAKLDEQSAMQAMLARYSIVHITGDETEKVEVTLERGASVSGRVLYADGSPAAGITILLESTKSKTAGPGNTDTNSMMNVGTIMRGMLMHQSQNTDDRGDFRIAGLNPGTYRVVAMMPVSGNPLDAFGGAMDVSIGLNLDSRAVRVFAGDTLHQKDAKVFELRGGEETTGVDITLPTEAFHTVLGQLAAKDGRAINMGSISLTDASDDSLVFNGHIDRSGSFVFATVPTGTYQLTVKGAQIGLLKNGMAEEMPLNEYSAELTAAFADAQMNVIVKDSDLLDVQMTLTEIPLPRKAKVPVQLVAPTDPDY